MRPAEVFASALLFSSLSSAWPSGLDLEVFRAVKNEIEPLVRRQDTSSKFDLSFTGQQGNTATTETASATDATSTGDDASKTTDASESGTKTGTATGSEKTTGTAKQTGTSTGTGKGSKTTTFDARLPAGGVSMITPNAQTTSYFKIDNYITFAWNYTSLSITPSYIDVLASCSLNQATYTIAMNQTVQPTQTLVWDTRSYQANATIPLLTETYTLIIHDAAKDVSATASPGYLGTYDQFTFGMYSPQPYTPMSDWVCATCNSALTQAERQTMWAIFAMVGVTVLSFGWFTGVAGLW